MAIDNEINKYKEIIIKSEYKKRKMLEVISKYFNEYINGKGDKKYYLSNLMQILILLETLNQSIEQTKVKLALVYVKNSLSSKIYNELNLIENNIFINSCQTQYKIELYKLMAMKDMDTEEYEEQVSLVKKYKELIILKKMM